MSDLYQRTNDEIRLIYLNGRSRNDISRALHVSHDRVQKVILSLEHEDKKIHNKNSAERVLRNREKAQERGIKVSEVTLASKYGLYMKYQGENEEMLKLIYKVSPPG